MIHKVSIVIPIFNEAETLQELLTNVYAQDLPGHLKKEMILVESNSSDGSRNIAQKFCADKIDGDIEIKLILQEKARGKGFAVREGLAQVTGDIILIQDADLEYETSDYPQLIQPLLDGHSDFVLGSRHLSAGSWKIRRFEQSPIKAAFMNFGGSLFHFIFNRLYRVTLTDPTTMYKVFLTRCIEGIPFECNRFDFDFELCGKLIRLGYVPLEVPISYRSRGFDKGKKVNMFRDPFTWIFAILRFRLKAIRRIPRAQRVTNNAALVYRS